MKRNCWQDANVYYLVLVGQRYSKIVCPFMGGAALSAVGRHWFWVDGDTGFWLLRHADSIGFSFAGNLGRLR